MKMDRRLPGTWRSDRRRTFRHWTPHPKASPQAVRKLKALFGKMVVTWGRSKVHTDLDGYRTSEKYEVVASDSVSVVVRLQDTVSDEERLHQIHFDGEGYWIQTPIEGIREHFRRVPRPAMNLAGNTMRCGGLLVFSWVGVCLVCFRGVADEPLTATRGDAVIRGKHGSSEIVITTTSRLAGAIHSLTWGGKEFIDSHDHGRQLQSAASFDCASSKEFWAECFNPTEAGSRADGVGGKSSSKLLKCLAETAELQTSTRMAFWLAPGEKSFGRPALNEKVLSDHVVSKRVRIGYKKWTNVIEYEVTFTVPAGERHTYAQFEALTAYMPPEFDRFWTFRPTSGKLESLSDGPGEQEFPVVFATQDGAHALGIFSPDQPSPGWEKAGYGRVRFKDEKVVKWNCVFRSREATGIAPGDHRFRLFAAVGTSEDVRQSLASLAAEFAAK